MFKINSQTVNIQGNVSSTIQPLKDVGIEVLGYNFGTTTDVDGNFFLTVNLSKQNTLYISHVGYLPKKINLNEINKDFNNLKIILIEDISGLNEVVVTGSLRDQYVSESAVKVNVISSKKINSFFPSAGSNISQISQLINGVQEVISCGVCYTNSISINGLDGPYTSILLDGIPMYGNLAAVYGLNGIPNMIIEKLEIVKGPSSTLYGSEALAGVINIITKNPDLQPIFSLDTQITSHKETFVNMSIAPKFNKTQAYIGINWDRKTNYEDYNNDGFGDDINLNRYSLFNKWKFYKNSGKEFILSSRYYYEDRRNGVEDFLKNNNYKKLRGSSDIYGESIYTKRFEVFGKYQFEINGLELNYSYSKHDQNSFYGEDFYKAKQEILFSQLTFSKKYNKHNLLYGISIKRNIYDDNTVATEKIENGNLINVKSDQAVPGILLQDKYRANDKTVIVGGLRLDYYNKHDFIYSPNIHLKYNPDQWLTLRLNIGTGFRIVNLFTEDHAFVSGQREVKILEELKPEKSKSIVFNSNYIFTLFKGSGNIDLDLFHTYFSNKILPNYENKNFIIYQNSNGSVLSKGLSTSLNYTLYNGVSISLNLNHQIVKYSEILNGIKNDYNVEHSPTWSGNINLKIPFKKSWSFNYSSNFTGVMRLPKVYDLNENGLQKSNPRPLKSKPFSIHNINITSKLKNENEVYFGALNLFDFRQKESPLVGYNDPNYNKGFSPFFDTSYAYAPNHGREIFFGYRLTINKNN